MPVAAHVAAPSEEDVRSDTLPGGFVATTTHAGSYDKLTDAHAAVQQWIEAEGLIAAGAPVSYTHLRWWARRTLLWFPR